MATGAMTGSGFGQRRDDNSGACGVRPLRALEARPCAAAPPHIVADPNMRALHAQVRRVARGPVGVLIEGETGTGKEAIMSAIHEHSGRPGRCVVVNCAALVPTLLESELFGHERGAFTGASQRRVGVFEHADGGTVCLDEVGELEAAAQASLLRVIETGRFCRVGGSEPIQVDVRVVAATHRALPAMVEAGAFRMDLYYRLATVTLRVPPLRERKLEIPLMARRFLEDARASARVAPTDFTPAALEALLAFRWPGNVRQLRNVVQRAAVLCEGEHIDLHDLQPELREAKVSPAEGAARVASYEAIAAHAYRPGESFRKQLRDYSAYLLDEALRHTGGRRGRAAAQLELPLRTFQRKVRELRLAAAASPDAPTALKAPRTDGEARGS